MIQIKQKTEELVSIQKKYPNAVIIDFTNKSNATINRLHPYYPYGDIPVPFSGGIVAESVGSLWQGLKVFEDRDVDKELIMNYLTNKDRRCQNKYGEYLGHRCGLHGLELLSIFDARRRIIVPSYKWMLEYKAQDVIIELRKMNDLYDIIFLDRFDNSEVYDYSQPVSHVYLVKAYVEGLFPYEDVYENHIIQHTYVGRKYISWTTYERRPKIIEPYIPNSQLEIPFDIG